MLLNIVVIDCCFSSVIFKYIFQLDSFALLKVWEELNKSHLFFTGAKWVYVLKWWYICSEISLYYVRVRIPPRMLAKVALIDALLRQSTSCCGIDTIFTSAKQTKQNVSTLFASALSHWVHSCFQLSSR